MAIFLATSPTCSPTLPLKNVAGLGTPVKAAAVATTEGFGEAEVERRKLLPVE